MKTNALYRTITFNIQNTISQFSDKKISKNALNQKLLLNLSSLIFFQKNKEKNKKEDDYFNESIEDVYVTYSKLSSIIKRKLNTIDTKEEEASLSHIDESVLDVIDTTTEKNNNFEIPIEDSTILNQSKINNEKSLFDDSQMLSMSMFNKNEDFAFNSTNNTSNKRFSTVSSKFKDNLNSLYKRKTTSIVSSNVTTRVSSNDSFINLKDSSQYKEAFEEFKLFASEEIIYESMRIANIDFIRGVYALYEKIEDKSKGLLSVNDKICYMNGFKEFLFTIGITEKTMYDNSIRSIIYNTEPLCFSELLECCVSILKLDFEQTYIKYKCKKILYNSLVLLYLTERKEEDTIDEDELFHYYDILSRMRKFDKKVNENIRIKLIDRYKFMFPNEDNFSINKLFIVLESFFFR